MKKRERPRKKRVILFLTQFFSIPGSSGPPSLQGGTQPNKQISVDAAAQIAVRQREAAAARRKEERRISESIEATERYSGSSPAASSPLPPVDTASNYSGNSKGSGSRSRRSSIEAGAAVVRDFLTGATGVLKKGEDVEAGNKEAAAASGRKSPILPRIRRPSITVESIMPGRRSRRSSADHGFGPIVLKVEEAPNKWSEVRSSLLR